jgi:alcohol/geraniol dehydrogenase (NADP+)
MFYGYAVHEPGGELKPFEYDPGPLGDDEIEIQVRHCGLCHSDLSMIDNDWQASQYPLVPGHEVVGTIVAAGRNVKRLHEGQRVGVGWFAKSCMTCEWCLRGDHNLCAGAQGIFGSPGRYGGFADRVRIDQGWATVLPDKIEIAKAGPLFCGGITVFNPLLQAGVRPVDRVAVVGIGGLGHMALQFLDKWGCDVTAFSSHADKEAEAREMGADHFVNSADPQALHSVAGSFDFILVTVNVALDWPAYLAALRPRGRLHFVGVPPAVTTGVMPLIVGQKSIAATPLGSPASAATMLDFAARHGIAPLVEHLPLAQVNEALARLRQGKPRYRIVLDMEGH